MGENMDKEIQQWQQSVTGPHDDSDLKNDGPAASLTAAACNLYQLTLQRLEEQLSKETHRKISQLLDYLRLWADGYGASSRDLDEILSKSKRLRQTTIQHLANICRLLAGQLVPIIEGKPDEEVLKLATKAKDLAEVASYTVRDSTDSDNSDSDDDYDGDGDDEPSSAPSPLDDVFRDLETEIQCLQALGPRFEEPILDKKTQSDSDPSIEARDWNPEEYIAARIRHRYPEGDPDVITFLAKTNWQRILRLHAARDRSHLEAETKTSQEATKRDRASEYDSGLGSSIARTTSYAETLKNLRWVIISMEDLRPYVCLEKACKFADTPLPDKEMWIQHLELDHDFSEKWEKAVCPLCSKMLGTSKQAAISHLSGHLEEDALAILPTNADLDDEAPENVSGHETGSPLSDDVLTQMPPPLKPGSYAPEIYGYKSNELSDMTNFKEDGTQISDLVERRRIQNRIVQRNYRKKLKRRLEDLEQRASNSTEAEWPTLQPRVEEAAPLPFSRTTSETPASRIYHPSDYDLLVDISTDLQGQIHMLKSARALLR